MIFKLALRNILGNGWRSFINVLILSIVLIIMVWTQAMYYSWIRLAETQQSDWEYGKGILRSRAYDPLDPLSFDDSQRSIPDELQNGVASGDLVPILVAPATIYPQMRMQSAVIKGIPVEQDILELPSQRLSPDTADLVPVLIGQAMAKSSRLDTGDIFTISLREVGGSYNAIDAVVADVLQIPAASIDIGTIWVNLTLLQEMLNAPKMASYLVIGDNKYLGHETQDFRFVDKAEYFADLYQMLETERFQQVLMYALLVFLAMIAIFDTQALAVFKRRREIGTLSALGLTKARIAMLFTLEGTLYTIAAIICTPILGFPLFWYFATEGFPILEGYDEFGVMGFTEPIRFVYPIHEIIVVFAVILVFTIFVSWLPTRKIARLNPVDALRGKVD